MNENNLFKYRSVTACMKASYDLISDHVGSLLKKTWWAVLIYAVLMALTVYFRLPNKGLHDWGEANPWASYIIQTIIYIGAFLSFFVASSSIWTWLNKRSIVKNLSRFFTTFIWVNLLLFVSLSATSYLSQLLTSQVHNPSDLTTSGLLTNCAALGVSLLLMLLYLLLSLPFAYLVPRNLLRKEGEKLQPWKAYKIGFRHLGGNFAIGFLGTLMIAIISLFLFLPMAVLGWSQISAQLGALQGDPLGTPSYFTLLVIVVLTATFFLFFYLCTWMSVSFVFQYGSIEIKEKNKQEMLAQQQAIEEENKAKALGNPIKI